MTLGNESGMRSLPLFVSFLVIVQLLGCTATPFPYTRQLSVGVAVLFTDGRTPTSQQIANIRTAMSLFLSRAGYRIEEKGESAELIATVSFTPNASDPNSGRISILNFESALEFRRDSVSAFEPAKEALEEMRAIHEMADSRAGLRN